MTKKQFLEELYQSLAGSLGKEESYSHIQYYDEYIESEKLKGQSEEAVIKNLGNPRHIAKTILASAGNSTNDYIVNDKEEDGKNKTDIFQRIKFWIKVIVIIAIVFLVLRFLFIIFIKIALPILFVMGAYKLIKKLF